MSAPTYGQNYTYAGNNANNKQAQVSCFYFVISFRDGADG
jgi:hypothetical protein